MWADLWPTFLHMLLSLLQIPKSATVGNIKSGVIGQWPSKSQVTENVHVEA